MVKAKEAVQWFEDWGLTPETANEVLNNYSAFLCAMTGGRLSKIGYDVQTMETVANDYQDENCAECFYRHLADHLTEKDGATVNSPASSANRQPLSEQPTNGDALPRCSICPDA